MKKIVIPTDFPVPAENAAHYAPNPVKVPGADVLFCKAIKVSAQPLGADQAAYPVRELANSEKKIRGELDTVNQKFNNSFSNQDQHYSVLTYRTYTGVAAEVLSAGVKEGNAEMVVTGMAAGKELTQVILRSNGRGAIEPVETPVLPVPP